MVAGNKRSRFVLFGPPIGNLLPPDDADAVLILYCEQRPALHATSRDRFFVTPHYGDGTEPGPIITRLSENTVDDLPELGGLARRDLDKP